MIANFFQNLNARGVEYLLIGGQATVLYGAATFSEDIDLWLNPSAENCDRFLTILRDCGARYYKLTPPFTPGSLQRGHGFHFILSSGEDKAFLDVMGKPPRAGSFAAAIENARWLQTEWGAIRTVGVRVLVELKKTQRLEDYPIISKLALAWFDQPECAKKVDDFFWALKNIFTLPELNMFFTEHPQVITLAGGVDQEVMDFGRQLLATGDVPESIEQPVRELFQKRIAELQKADRHYWRDIIGELKALRAAGKLMSEGSTL
jgi:hypothetical protein